VFDHGETMSEVVAALLDNAYQDTQLLISNDQHEDIFSEFREVDFTLYSKKTKKRASLLLALSMTTIMEKLHMKKLSKVTVSQ